MLKQLQGNKKTSQQLFHFDSERTIELKKKGEDRPARTPYVIDVM